jgi:hypothetical protein
MASSCADLAARRHQSTLQEYAQKKVASIAAKLSASPLVDASERETYTLL